MSITSAEADLDHHADRINALEVVELTARACRQVTPQEMQYIANAKAAHIAAYAEAHARVEAAYEAEETTRTAVRLQRQQDDYAASTTEQGLQQLSLSH